MTLLTRPYMQTANAHLLPIDRNDPTLAAYFPLWYPHGDMTGSTIYSYDWNRLTGTVTGATWGRQGRTFDGSDDNIILPANWMPSTGTVIIWAKWSFANAGHLFSSDLNEISIYVNTPDAGVTGRVNLYYQGASAVFKLGLPFATNTFAQIAVTFTPNGSGFLYLNGSLAHNAALTAGTPTNVATRLGEATSGVNDFTGTIGEVMIYNRVLAAAEILSIYNATKWRYI